MFKKLFQQEIFAQKSSLTTKFIYLFNPALHQATSVFAYSRILAFTQTFGQKCMILNTVLRKNELFHTVKKHACNCPNFRINGSFAALIVSHRSHVWLEGSPAELGADVPRVYISIQLFNLSSLHLIQLAAPRGAGICCHHRKRDTGA